MKKRICSFILALTMASGMAGCSGNSAASSGTVENGGSSSDTSAVSAAEENFNPTGLPIVKEKITLTGFGNQNVTHADWNTLICFSDWEEKSNIHVEWTTAPNQSYNEKKSVLFASGDYPDIFYRAQLTAKEENQYGNQGVLVDLTELIDQYGVNFKERCEEYPNIMKEIRQPEGQIYSLPFIQPYTLPSATQKNWINKAWLDRVGLNPPQTTEEFYQALKAFKEQDANGNGDPNDEIPYTDRPGAGPGEGGGEGLLKATYGSFGIGNLGNDASANFVDRGPDGKLRFFATSDNFKMQLEWLHQMFAEELLDPELFTQDIAAFNAKSELGIIGARFSGDGSNSLGKSAEVEIAEGEPYQTNAITLRVLEGPNGDRQFTNLAPMCRSGAFAISSTSKYPREAMRWVDYYYGYEGDLLIRLGREGLTYEKNETGDGYYLTDIVEHNPDIPNRNQAMGQYAIGFAGGSCPEFVFPDIDLARSQPDAAECRDIVLQDYDPSKTTVVKFNFTADEQEKLAPIQDDILTYVNEMKVAFITGKASFDDWDKYVANVEKMNLEEYLEIYEKAYDRFMNA